MNVKENNLIWIAIFVVSGGIGEAGGRAERRDEDEAAPGVAEQGGESEQERRRQTHSEPCCPNRRHLPEPEE